MIDRGKEYEADYVLTVAHPPLPLPIVYANRSYAVYSLQ